MTTRNERAIEQTDRLLDLVQRLDTSHLDPGITWDALRHRADSAIGEDELAWDDAMLSALALTAEARRPVPVDVAERHLAAMHAELDPVRTSQPSSWRLAWRRRLAGAAAAATAFTTLGGGAAVAVAQEAAPGDALYGVKRASEQARLLLERSSEADAALHLEFAQRRLQEASQAPGVADELLPAAFEHLAAAEADGDAETQEAARAVGQGAIDALAALLDGELPEAASDRAVESLRRNLERKQAHQAGRDAGETGRDRAPGQQRDDAPGRSGDASGRSGDAPGRSGDDPGRDGRPAAPNEPGAPSHAGPPETAGPREGAGPHGR